MRTKLISSRVRHTVTFAPNPENPAFGTSPVFVMARDVSQLEDIPAGIKHLHFQDVVVSKVRIGEQELTLESKPFNEEHHHVVWTELEAKRFEAQGHDVQVAVPPHLENQVWVFEPKSRAEKRFAETAKLSPEQAFTDYAENIAAEVSAMSDEEVDAYIKKHGLEDLAKPERLEAILAQALGDPRKTAQLLVVWDKDKPKPETED